MKTDLAKELAFKKAEFEKLKILKKKERQYIVNFQQYITSKHHSHKLLRLKSNKKTYQKPESIQREKSSSPCLNDLSDIDIFKLEGKKLAPGKAINDKILLPYCEKP